MPNTPVPAAATGLPIAKRRLDPVPADLADLPEWYAMQCEGICMSPTLADGCRAVFRKTVPCEQDDIVVVWFRPEYVKPGGHRCLVKRLATNLPPNITFPHRTHPKSEIRLMVMLAMDAEPGRWLPVPCDQILAMHKHVGELDSTGAFVSAEGVR